MLLSLFVSLDSFIASFGLGLLTMPRQRICQTCFLFGLCDGLATLAGLHLASRSALTVWFNHSWIVPAGLCAWIFFVAFLAHQIVVWKPTSILVISLVPVILSIDNLLASPFSSESFLPTKIALITAILLSTGFAAVGFAIAPLLQNRISRSIAMALGAILLCLAPILF